MHNKKLRDDNAAGACSAGPATAVSAAGRASGAVGNVNNNNGSSSNATATSTSRSSSRIAGRRSSSSIDLQNPPSMLSAIIKGHYTVVLDALLSDSRCGVNGTESDCNTPLATVVASGEIGVNTGSKDALALISGGANVNLATSTGETPLVLAAEAGHVSCVELLLKHGAEVNRGCYDDNASPLMLACAQGRLQVVRLLLDAGADVDPPDTDSCEPPIFSACEGGHAEIMRALIDAGADLNRKRAYTLYGNAVTTPPAFSLTRGPWRMGWGGGGGTPPPTQRIGIKLSVLNPSFLILVFLAAL